MNNVLINHSDVIVIMLTFNSDNKEGAFIAARNGAIKMYKGAKQGETLC